jgi:hypothetical protein
MAYVVRVNSRKVGSFKIYFLEISTITDETDDININTLYIAVARG